jgi:hypothetical protein
MPCCLVLAIVLLSPRIVLALLFFFSDYLGRAFHHQFLIPLLGFIFLPITTLVYAWEVNNHMPLEGINLVFLVIAVIVDLGAHGGGASRKWRNNN